MLLFYFRSKGSPCPLTKARPGLSGLGKKSPPLWVVFFARALLLPDTHLFMLMKQNIAYCGSLDE
jgi:hypothetical protein